MKDWKAIANAAGIELDTAPLEALDRVFRPLAATLTSDVEPATEFHPEEDR